MLRYKNAQHMRPSTDEYMQALCSMGVGYAIITGGDPLFPAEISRTLLLASALRDADIPFSIDTALVVDGLAVIQQLALTKVEMLYVSCDSHIATIHNFQRGQWEKTIAGIRAAIDLGVPVTVNCGVTALNYQHIEEAVSWFLRLGVRAVDLNIVAVPQCHPRFAELSCEALPEDEQKKLVGMLLRCASQGRQEATRSAYALFQGKLFLNSTIEVPVHCQCKMGSELVVIDEDGLIKPCFHTDEAWGTVWHHEDIDRRIAETRSAPFMCAGKHCASLFAIDAFWKEA
jgi:MoaA/NifB/PqqE/SkfB family radical SAM enzyme